MNTRQKRSELMKLVKGVRCCVLLEDQAFEVSNIEAARDHFLWWIDANQLGASDIRDAWTGDVYFMGKRVARVTYNGRIEEVRS